MPQIVRVAIRDIKQGKVFACTSSIEFILIFPPACAGDGACGPRKSEGVYVDT
jgi:hypothetical protein